MKELDFGPGDVSSNRAKRTCSFEKRSMRGIKYQNIFLYDFSLVRTQHKQCSDLKFVFPPVGEKMVLLRQIPSNFSDGYK